MLWTHPVWMNLRHERKRLAHHPLSHWLVLELLQKRHSLHWEMNRGMTLSPEIQKKMLPCYIKFWPSHQTAYQIGIALSDSVEQINLGVHIANTSCNHLLTWLKFSNSRPNTLNDASSLVAQNRWEAIFMHTLKQMVQVCVAHSSCHNLHQR